MSHELDELRQQVKGLVAREAIRDVLYRYARGVDRADVDLLKSCYFEDAIDAHTGAFIGPAHEFAEMTLTWEQLGQLRDYRHYITNVLIELDGDQAFVESSFLCTLELPLGDPDGDSFADAQAEGRYFDVMQCRNGEWKIWRRLMISEKLVWRERPDQPPGARPEAGAMRFPRDPVYLGFGIAEALPDAFRYEGDVWEFTKRHFA